MAGTRLTFTIDDQQTRAALDKLQHLDTAPLMRRLGERIQAFTQDRFDEQKSPDGKLWDKLNPDYAKTKPAHNRDKILTSSGDLHDYIHWQLLNAQTVLVGSNAKYAAIHQFGGTIRPKRGKALSFGGRFFRSVKIPARPFLGISAKDKKEIREIVIDWVLTHRG